MGSTWDWPRMGFLWLSTLLRLRGAWNVLLGLVKGTSQASTLRFGGSPCTPPPPPVAHVPTLRFVG